MGAGRFVEGTVLVEVASKVILKVRHKYLLTEGSMVNGVLSFIDQKFTVQPDNCPSFLVISNHFFQQVKISILPGNLVHSKEHVPEQRCSLSHC